MSTRATAESVNPSWKQPMESVLAENMKQGNKDSLNIQLATMPSSNSVPQRPSNRTVVFRGFCGQARTEDEPTGGNPVKGITSNLIVVSTDIRMLKAKQVAAQQQGEGNNGFEVCWWHQGTQEQFRFCGKAWLLTSLRDSVPGFPGDRLKDQYMCFADEADREAWSWEGERLRQFAKHSPALRASFQNPDPASPLTEDKERLIKAGHKLPVMEDAKTDEERARIQTALDNLSLLVLELEEVDYLKVAPPAERKKWILDGGRWQEQICCP